MTFICGKKPSTCETGRKSTLFSSILKLHEIKHNGWIISLVMHVEINVYASSPLLLVSVMKRRYVIPMTTFLHSITFPPRSRKFSWVIYFTPSSHLIVASSFHFTIYHVKCYFLFPFHPFFYVCGNKVAGSVMPLMLQATI